jgi:hypothetical protein
MTQKTKPPIPIKEQKSKETKNTSKKTYKGLGRAKEREAEQPTTEAEELEMENPRSPGIIRAERLAAIEKVLTEAKWPEMSPFWREVFERASFTTARNIVGEGGRRIGKSSNICGKWIPCELTSGLHNVPPGDVGYYAIISADKDQAQERLDTVHKALVALNVPHKKTANDILLTDSNLGVKVFAATTSAVVAFTCIGFLCDEVAMWRDKDSGANPARQIIEALRPTMITMPNAKGWFVSAVWDAENLHAEMVDAGNSEAQYVFRGTTTQGNPTLTDADILRLEPDEQTRLRAYYNVRLAQGETAFFPGFFIDRARLNRIVGDADKIAAGVDLAFRKNSSAMSVASKLGAAVRLDAVEERIPGSKPLKPSETMRDLIGLAQSHGAEGVASDQHYQDALKEVLEEYEISFVSFPGDSDGISQAYIRLRVLLAEELVDLSRAPERFIKQLKNTKQKPGDGATLKIIHPVGSDGSHGDCVASFVCATWLLEQETIGEHSAVGSRRFPRGGESQDEFSMLPDGQME